MFDLDGKGWISIYEMLEGLQDLGIFASKEEVILYYGRYDKDHDDRLRFSDFCDALTPKDIAYADILNNRTPYYIHTPQYRRDEYFHPSTRQ
jgi:hypothetical protein